MDKITRYLILLIIIFVFIVLAPLIVLYVSGAGFNFGEQFSAGTGILDIQSSPNDAEVYLNDDKLDNTPTTLRFIKQGTYKVRVNKNGYRPWEKQLFIQAGQVTYAGTVSDLVTLLPDEQPVLLEQADVVALAGRGDQLIYIKEDGNAVLYDQSNKKVLIETKLTLPIVSIKEIVNQNFLLATTTTKQVKLLEISSLELIDLPSNFTESRNIQVSNDGMVFADMDGKLLVYDPEAKQTYTGLSNDVLAFTINNNLIYVASSEIQKSLVTYFWDGAKLIPESTLLSDALPNAKSYQLMLTDHKELFLYSDTSLYRVNQQLDLLNDQVIYVNLNSYRSQLTFATSTEVLYYNFVSNKVELHHRTTSKIYDTLVIPELGYGFKAIDNGVEAVEIDNRNGQNHYRLIDNGPVTKMFLSYNEANLIALLNGKIYSVAVAK